MAKRRVNVSLSDALFAKLERRRGDVSRSRWVERALESALGGAEEPVQKVSGRSVSAPARASVKVPVWEEPPALSPEARNVAGKEFVLPKGVDRASAFLAASQRRKKS